MTLLGIDVGTGGSRALLVGDDGRILASSTAAHEAVSSPRDGWAEQDPHDWWRASAAAVRSALDQAQIRPDAIAGVGLSGQMHGAVLLDERHEPLRPALIWADQRTAAQCRALVERVGEARIIELTSNPALTAFTLPKLMWVREHEPETWSRVHRVLLPKDYVRLQLTGEQATDVADASGTLLFDVANRRWSEAMLEAAELDGDLLARVYESPEITGSVSAAGAAATGLVAGTPVVAGAGDQAAGAVGMGVVEPGVVSVTIGTSGVVFAATANPVRDPLGRLHTFCHAVPGRWHVMGVTQAAGLSLQWFAELVDAGDGYERLLGEAAAAPAGSAGVLWAPYLMGERTPHLDPDARAALIGLTATHERAHVVRAILEGVAFSLRDSFTIFGELGIPVQAVRLGGGGARSALWRQIQADAYGREVEVVEVEEGAAYGAALLAGVGAGVWRSVDEACAAVVRVASRIACDADAAATLDTRYAEFRRVYAALKSVTG